MQHIHKLLKKIRTIKMTRKHLCHNTTTIIEEEKSHGRATLHRTDLQCTPIARLRGTKSQRFRYTSSPLKRLFREVVKLVSRPPWCQWSGQRHRALFRSHDCEAHAHCGVETHRRTLRLQMILSFRSRHRRADLRANREPFAPNPMAALTY